MALPPRSRFPGLVGKGKVRYQPMEAGVGGTYHFTLRTQGSLTLPSRDPAEV